MLGAAISGMSKNVVYLSGCLMENDLRLAIILLNWDSAIDTIKSIVSISLWSELKAGIFVVDNFSSGEDIVLLEQSDVIFRLIKNSSNLGYAGGCNRGIAAALDEGYQSVMLLNSDACIDEPCVIRLLEFIEQDPRIGVIGPLLNEGGDLYSGGRNIGIYSKTRIHYKFRQKMSQLIEADYVPGTVMLTRKDVFESIGQLDEKYFFSGEVADFCWRARSAGLTCVIYQGCQASHLQNIETGLRETLYNYYILRNRFLFIRKNFDRVKIIFGLRWMISGWVQILIALFLRKPDRARALWLGLKDGIRGIYGNRNDRFDI